jgi:beta-glucanase (GH16 family)
MSLCFWACGEKKPPPNNTAPTNLTLTAQVSSDNSGNVSFVATATNAVSYDFDFGNGIFQTVVSGTTTYRYPAAGTYVVNVIAKSAAGLTASKSITITVSVSQSLIWSDEFNTPGAPDPAKWGYDLGAGGWGNNELQYYTNRSDNAVVSGGTLKIIAKRENFSGSAFTSARLLSRSKFSFKYGKVEISAKLPVGVGTWPATWMLGDNFLTAGWPACGEIDIMEHRGSELNTITSALHYPGRSGGNPVKATTVVSTATSAFHVYRFDWTSTSLKFYVDDKLFHEVQNNANIPYNKDFFILLNLAMGGGFGGPVDPAFTSATFEVDYVRVYR